MDDGREELRDQELHAAHWAQQASGLLRGMVIGVSRTLTRPAQMRVIVWLAKRKYKEAKGKDVRKHLHLGPILVEGLIGAATYDIYGTFLSRCEEQQTFARLKAYEVYGCTFASGMVAGASCAVMNAVHNNLLRRHIDSFRSLRRVLTGSHRLSWSAAFNGAGAAVPRDALATGALFMTNAWFKRNLPQPSEDSLLQGTIQSFIAGGLAGTCGTLVAVPLIRAGESSTQYVGVEFFNLAKKLAVRDSASFAKYVFAGLPAVAAGAFFPNAMGMSMLYLGSQLNKVVEDASLDPVLPAKSRSSETPGASGA